MDWWTSLAACIALLWIFCFIDGNAVLELRLLFHALTKAACHLYLALLPLRRAATHFADCARYLISHAQQTSSPHHHHGYQHQSQPLARKGTLHFLEGMCVVCETLPNLMGAALSVGAAFCHMIQGGFLRPGSHAANHPDQPVLPNERREGQMGQRAAQSQRD
ncbi:hypothetical protein D5F01_LYC14898 [Larimichthys crocea]|uniref:Uncharacterized protein n=1 Tax=Larimichthys crocea TaxID=215358 RepID=A0A6G0I6N0_LARCR|nr:hypothetical protein D5F01_LYC14898 [Larimichthys crocea]